MEQATKAKTSVKEAEAHYESSRANYTIEGAESHLTYYREKHPDYYGVLSQNV